MREETHETDRPLRFGYTTGACATVTSLAAARLLLTGESCQQVSIDLPKGQRVEFSLEYCHTVYPHAVNSDAASPNALISKTADPETANPCTFSLTNHQQTATAAVIKDAGDDPDVTHRALIKSQVSLSSQPGVRFHAGPGVGTVTLTGLDLAIGEPAINPVPRQMMTQHLTDLANATSYDGGFDVTIAVEDGEALAQKTMNPRLGIMGGLSILGTTGIVRPFSCSAYIASIHQGIDVAKANGHQMIAASTGSTSEDAIRRIYDLPEMALLEMGDFVGAVLKYLKRAPVNKVVLAAGFGKLSKLACGHLDLHSRKSSIDFEFLARQARQLGAEDSLCEQIENANTSLEALRLCQQYKLGLGDQICKLAQQYAQGIVPDTVSIEVWAFDKQGEPVGCARFQPSR